jgi:hypothetical protein
MDLTRTNEKDWATRAVEEARGLCANCGSEHKVSARLIVPVEAGGKTIPGNIVVLCRACELASGYALKQISEKSRRLVNIWVSHRLYKSLLVRKERGVSSISSLVRFLMAQYVATQSRFDDITQYQDGGSDVRLNIWVDADLYQSFKTLVDRQGMTVTSALKSLFCMYEAEAIPLVELRNLP